MHKKIKKYDIVNMGMTFSLKCSASVAGRGT